MAKLVGHSVTSWYHDVIHDVYFVFWGGKSSSPFGHMTGVMASYRHNCTYAYVRVRPFEGAVIETVTRNSEANERWVTDTNYLMKRDSPESNLPLSIEWFILIHLSRVSRSLISCGWQCNHNRASVNYCALIVSRQFKMTKKGGWHIVTPLFLNWRCR